MEYLLVLFANVVSLSCIYTAFHGPVPPMMHAHAIPVVWHKPMMIAPPVPPPVNPHMQQAMINHDIHMKQKMILQQKMKHQMLMEQKMLMKQNILMKQQQQQKMKAMMKLVKPKPVFKPILKPAFKKPQVPMVKPKMNMFGPKIPIFKPKIKYFLKKVKFVNPPKRPVIWANTAYRPAPRKPVSRLPVPVFRQNVFTGYRPASRSQRVDLPLVTPQRPRTVYRQPVQPLQPVQPIRPVSAVRPAPSPVQPVRRHSATAPLPPVVVREYTEQAVQQQPIAPPRQYQWSRVAYGAYPFNDDDDDDFDDDDDKFEDYWEDRFDDWKDRVEDRLDKRHWRYYDEDGDDRFDDFEIKDYARGSRPPYGRTTIQHTVSQGRRPVVSAKYIEEQQDYDRKYNQNLPPIKRIGSFREKDVQIRERNPRQKVDYENYPAGSDLQPGLGEHRLKAFRDKMAMYSNNANSNTQQINSVQSGDFNVRNPETSIYNKQNLDFGNTSDLRIEHTVTFDDAASKYFRKFDDDKSKRSKNIEENKFSQSQSRNIGNQNTFSRTVHTPNNNFLNN